jgi:hypothetical protein
MKRDCGPGDLIPYKWEVVSCKGMSDDETKSTHDTLELAKIEFEKRLLDVKETNCSNIRLYVKDKKGYMNCIRHWSKMANGEIMDTNRFNEL